MFSKSHHVKTVIMEEAKMAGKIILVFRRNHLIIGAEES